MTIGSTKNRKIYVAIIPFCLCVCLLLGAVAHASLFGGEKNDPLSKAEKGVTYLLKILKDSNARFDPQKVADLVSFAGRTHSNPAGIVPKSVDDATGGYWEFNLAVPLKTVASYVFNPQVPPEAVFPSNVRLGGWHDPARARQQLSGFWSALPNVPEPMVFRGMEYEENTPDATSGCYYRYDLNRLLILYTQEDGRDVLISVSRLAKPSSVGKKGLPVGPKNDWNFFYSGREGNLLSGLGWADSYIYDSISAYVFQQPDPDKPLTRVGMFKWVSGGWKSVNMVKNKHVVKGCQNVAMILRQLLQAKSMPSPEKIVAEAKRIDALPEAQLREKFQPVAELIEKKAATDSKLARDEFSEIIQNGRYAALLSPEELRSELVKDYIRSKVLGKSLLAVQKGRAPVALK